MLQKSNKASTIRSPNKSRHSPYRSEPIYKSSLIRTCPTKQPTRKPTSSPCKTSRLKIQLESPAINQKKDVQQSNKTNLTRKRGRQAKHIKKYFSSFEVEKRANLRAESLSIEGK